MTGKPGGSVRQRRVSAELRALRETRNLTCEQVAEALGCSIGKISRMETGVRGLYPDDVAAILGFLQAPAHQREELLALVREGQKPNWIQVGTKLPAAWKDLIRFEDQAVKLYNYEPLVVPGLLQTGDYARTVIQAGNRQLTDPEVDQLVRTRMARQALLSRPQGPTLSVIIDEMVLRRPIGDPGLMRAQLNHLLNRANHPRIRLRIIPFKIGAYPGLEGPTMILEFADQPTLLLMEVRGATGLLEEAPVIRRAKLAWQELLSLALPPDDSAQLIAAIAGELP